MSQKSSNSGGSADDPCESPKKKFKFSKPTQRQLPRKLIDLDIPEDSIVTNERPTDSSPQLQQNNAILSDISILSKSITETLPQKQTSTPIVSDRLPMTIISEIENVVNALSLSSISKQQTTPDLTVSDNQLDSDLSTATSVWSDHEECFLPVNFKIVRNKGKDWNHFKPQINNSLYGRILLDPEDLMNTAKAWVAVYKENWKTGLLELYQFFIDVIGIQDFHIEENYRASNFLTENNFEILLNKLVNHAESTAVAPIKILFDGQSVWAKQRTLFVILFLDLTLTMSHKEGLLYDGKFLLSLSNFFNVFGKSNIAAIAHTVTVIILKLISIFTLIRLENRKKSHHDKILRDNQIEEVMSRLLNIAGRKCLLKVCSWEQVLLECCREVVRWYELMPTYFFETKFLKIILFITQNQDSKVRLYAMECCQILIKMKSFKGYFQPFLKQLFEIIGKRVGDIDMVVKIAAIKFFTATFESYGEVISNETRGHILNNIYSTNYPVAAVAGEFFMKCFEGQNSSTIFKKIIAFDCQYKRSISHTPFLVEAFIECTPQLQDWQVMIDLLLNDDLNSEEQASLAFIMSEAVQQIIKGVCRYKRTSCREVVADGDVVPQVTFILLDNMKMLLEKYVDDDNCKNHFFEMLLFIDYSYIGALHKQKLLDIILLLCCNLENRNVSEKIGKVFSLILKQTELTSVQRELLSIQQIVVNEYLTFMEDSPSSYDESKFVANVHILSVLFPCHKLNALEVEGWNWDALYIELDTIEPPLPPQLIKDYITCYYYFIIWEAEILLENLNDADFQNRIESLQSHITLLLQMCFRMLENQQNDVCTKICEVICDIYLKINTHYFKPTNITEQLRQLTLKSPDNEQLISFFTKLENVIFLHPQGELRDRFLLLQKSLALGFKFIPKLLAYFQAHYEDFGKIFENYLNAKRRTNAAMNLIFDTIKTYVQDKSVGGDLQEHEDTHLKNLINRFKEYIGKKKDDLKYLVDTGRKDSPRNLLVLKYLCCFTETVNDSKKNLKRTSKK